jgi:hypothetical protein
MLLCSFQGFETRSGFMVHSQAQPTMNNEPSTINQKAFLVQIAQWNHTDPIPNSEVKRCCGEDSWRVTSCQNSSVPGLFIKKKPHSFDMDEVSFFYIGKP